MAAWDFEEETEKYNVLNDKRVRAGIAIVCVVLILASFLVAAPRFENIDTYEAVTRSLDNKRSQVVEMSGALVGLSVAVAAVPGDATTPIANQIAQLNSYLVIALGAVMLEKFLLPIMGFITWRLLIPAGLVLAALFFILKKRMLLSAAIRIVLLGLVLFSIIPAGIKVGDLMDDSFGTGDMIERIKADISVINAEAEETEEIESEAAGTEGNLWDKIVSKGEEIVNGIKTGGNQILEMAKTILGEIMDVVAALIVTACVIPIGIIAILAAIIKALFGAITKWIPIKKREDTGLAKT